MTETISPMLEKASRAVFDCIDPTSGDPLGVLLHALNPFIDSDAPVADQIAQARTIADAATRAVIEALMEPDEAMIEAGHKAIFASAVCNPVADVRSGAAPAYRAMLNAILHTHKGEG